MLSLPVTEMLYSLVTTWTTQEAFHCKHLLLLNVHLLRFQMSEPGNQQGPPIGPPGVHQGRVPPQDHRDMRGGWDGAPPSGQVPFMGDYPPRGPRPGKQHRMLYLLHTQILILVNYCKPLTSAAWYTSRVSLRCTPWTVIGCQCDLLSLGLLS